MTSLDWSAPGLTPAAGDGGGPAADGGISRPDRAAVTTILTEVAGDLPAAGGEQEAMPRIAQAVRAWAQRLAATAGTLLSRDEQAQVAQAVYDERYGLGPLEACLRDAGVENVDINGWDNVWITYGTGDRAAVRPVFASDDDLIAFIRRLAARGGHTGREFTDHQPLLNVAVGSGIRMTATMSVTARPCVSLRRHGHLDVSLATLTGLGTIDDILAQFLGAAVRARLNIIITGGVAAGKTTLLRALASEIPPGERVATLETEYELGLHRLASHPDVIAFEEREPNSEGAGGVTLLQLIAHALRHNPRRILLGEVRRGEIIPMLEAMNSGQDGSMCTMHANSPEEAFGRILILGLRGGLALAERAIHILVGMSVDLIVHIRQRYDGHQTLRYVSEVLEVLPPGDTDRPSVNRIFTPDGPGGRAALRHSPSHGTLRRLEAAGFGPDQLATAPARQGALR